MAAQRLTNGQATNRLAKSNRPDGFQQVWPGEREKGPPGSHDFDLSIISRRMGYPLVSVNLDKAWLLRHFADA